MKIREQRREGWFFAPRAALAAGAIVAAIGATGCGGVDPFVKASGSFATAATTGVDTLTPMFATASRLCRTRARLHYTFMRGSGPTSERWSKWYTEYLMENRPGDTWKAHCDMLATSDAMLARGLEAIGVYAEVLKAASESAGYDGKSLEDLIKDSARLAGALSGNTTSSKSITDNVAGLSGPIAFIAKRAAQAYASRKLGEAVRSTSPQINIILAALKKYNADVEPSIRDAERRLADVLDQADASIRAEDETAKPDAMQVLAFHDTALRYEEELADLRSAWAAYGRALEALSEANTALSGAVDENGDIKDEAALKRVLGFAHEVMTQLAIVKSVAAGGKE